MKPPVRINEAPTIDPLCPHCERKIQEIGARRIESTLGVRFIYFCNSCGKVLGVSHRKGFWMG